MFNLKDFYISIFDELNKKNRKYSSLSIEYESNTNIDCLNKMNINFDRIKEIYFYQIEENYKTYFNEIYERFFELFNIKTNLVSLYFEMPYSWNNKLMINSFKNLNSFHSLINIYFSNINLSNIFEIDLPNLKTVSFTHCENIIFSINTCKTIKELTLKMCTFSKLDFLLKFPLLETLILYTNNYSKEKYSSLIDFSSLENCIYFQGLSCDFILFEKTKLKEVCLSSLIDNSFEIEKKMIEKFCDIKTLKNIKFNLDKMNDEQISNIIGENSSVEKIHILWGNKDDDCILFNLQKKFPNLSNLVLYTLSWYYFTDYNGTNLNIIENPNCKITNIKLTGGGNKNIKLYCQKYENLISIEFSLVNKINNFETAFPIFNNKSSVKFLSLSNFCFVYLSRYEINLEILNNIYNILSNMPKLKKFRLESFKKIDENNNEAKRFRLEFEDKFNKKLKDLKIKFIFKLYDDFSYGDSIILHNSENSDYDD